MSKNIQVLRPYFRVDETLEEIRECLERGWTGIGFKTEQFENAWKMYSGFEYAHFLNSATAGLHLAIKLFKEEFGWVDGDEVITTSLTFVSTNHAILYENLKPVFADVDNSLCLNPASVEALISNKTRAILYVGIGGNAANYKKIKQICAEKNLILILDAAHMSGTRWADTGEHVGLDADCSVFSYQAVKNLPSSDSGMICFKYKLLDQRARRQSWLGIDKSTYERFTEGSYKWRYDVPELGYKYNGNSIAAAMCLVSLRYLEQDNAHRRMLAATYDEFLSISSAIEVVKHDPSIISSRHLFQISVQNRDLVLESLYKNGIYCGVHYVANHNYSIYSNCKRDVKTSEYYSSSLVSLPMHLGVTKDDAANIATTLLAL